MICYERISGYRILDQGESTEIGPPSSLSQITTAFK
ncbi:unnamed protein product, partial [Allacma fusca]